MRTRIGVLLLAVLACLLIGGPPAQAQQVDLVKLVDSTAYFSPNGDGVVDQNRVVFRLERSASVRVVISDRHGDEVGRERLGVLSAGRHVWRWDGRSSDGSVVPDGVYGVKVRAESGGTADRINSDTTVVSQPDAGRLVLSRPIVYPAATAVVDSLAVAYVRKGDSEVDRVEGPYFGNRPLRLVTKLRITGPDGVTVFDGAEDGYRHSFKWTARDDNGQALPPGDYRILATVTDEVGNSRTIRRTVAVSAEQLVERTWTTSISAASAEEGKGPISDPLCMGCGDVCDPVDSERFPGGLSFRIDCELGWSAVRDFGARPPVTPAPVDSFRITATGGPTTPEDGDVARFAGLTMGPGDASVTTPWQKVRLGRYPFLPDAHQPVTWGVSTSDGNSYDIASFTVEYRYYVPVE